MSEINPCAKCGKQPILTKEGYICNHCQSVAILTDYFNNQDRKKDAWNAANPVAEEPRPHQAWELVKAMEDGETIEGESTYRYKIHEGDLQIRNACGMWVRSYLELRELLHTSKFRIIDKE